MSDSDLTWWLARGEDKVLYWGEPSLNELLVELVRDHKLMPRVSMIDSYVSELEIVYGGAKSSCKLR